MFFCVFCHWYVPFSYALLNNIPRFWHFEIKENVFSSINPENTVQVGSTGILYKSKGQVGFQFQQVHARMSKKLLRKL